jgi:hypothetical protein
MRREPLPLARSPSHRCLIPARAGRRQWCPLLAQVRQQPASRIRARMGECGPPSPARPSVPLLRASPHKRRQLACAKKGVPSFVRGLRVGHLLRTHPSLTFFQEQYTIRVCQERGVRVEVSSRPCSRAGVVHTMCEHTQTSKADAARGECCLEPSLSVPRCCLNRGSHAPKRQPDTAMDGQGERGARLDSASVGCEWGEGRQGGCKKHE